MNIKAIETRYKGYRFRSRLEARWSVFFDACGYQWEYEPEGFLLPCGTHYLPDFKIYGKDMNGDYNIFYIEVKPSHEGIFDPKVKAFQNAIWSDLDRPDWQNRIVQGYGDFIILDGPPGEKLYHGTFEFNGDGGRQWLMEPFYRGRPSFWSEETYDDAVRSAGGDPNEWNPFCPIEKALSARFEHGETP